MGVRSASSVRKVTRDGKSHLVIDFRYVDKDGKPQRYRRDASVQTHAGARAEAERMKLMVATHGTLKPREKCATLAAFAEGSFTKLFLPKYRPATRVRYQALLRQGLLGALGKRPLDEIGAAHFRAFAADLEGRGVQIKGPINLLRTILRAAVEVGALEAMPSVPALVKPGKKLPDAPSEDEVAAMLKFAKGWLQLAIALAAYAGLRMGEVRGLEVRDVDLAQQQLSVRHALSENVVMAPKSGHERGVPVANFGLVALLTEATKGKFGKQRVVLTKKGTSPTRQAVLTRLKALQLRHGLPPRSFHALRHFFCSELLRRGASVEAVRVLAGHGSLGITQRYLHATRGDLAAAVAKLG